MISKFRLGVFSFIEGIRLLRNDKNIRALGFVPAVMSLTLFTVGLLIGMMYLDEILSWIIKINLNNYSMVLKSIIYIFSFLFLSLILYFTTFIVVSLLAIPVCTTLSKRVLIQTGYLDSKDKGFKENVFTFAKMTKISALKFLFILIISGLLLLASFVQVLSPFALYLSLMLLTFDCMDYSMELDEQGLNARFQFFIKHWVELTGFSFCMAIILAIPFIHFILLPAAVIGTSILYSRIQLTDKQNDKLLKN